MTSSTDNTILQQQSTGTTTTTKPVVGAKRKYSRNGCTECKKRRMKCDENKPKCWQCDRLGRDCVYVINQKNKKRRAPAAAGSSILMKKKASNTSVGNGITTPDEFESNESGSPILNPPQNGSILLSHQTTITNGQNIDIQGEAAAAAGTTTSIINEPLTQEDFLSLNDFNTLLYNDLNDLVHWRLEQTLTPNLQRFIETNENVFDGDLNTSNSATNTIRTANGSVTSHDDERYVPVPQKEKEPKIFHPPHTYDNKEIQLGVTLSEFKLAQPHMQYLEIFYHKFSQTLCPFQPISARINPIRDVLLNYSRNHTYLLYAILATGSRLRHKSTNEIHHDQAFCSYLSSCLTILGENFENDAEILDRIEPMLLTILLLTSDCGSSRNIRWRAHLRGAKELLKRSGNLGINTDVLNLCKNWLICYEVIAGLTNPYGGIFQDDLVDEIDQFIVNDSSYLKSLTKFKIIEEDDVIPSNGFNIMSGHLIQLDLVFKKIIILKNKARNYQGDDFFSLGEDLIDVNEVIELLTHLTNFEKINIIKGSNLGRIPPDHPSIVSHSSNIVQYSQLNNLTLSLPDISNYTHIQACKLLLLTEFLNIPITSTLIHQSLTNIISYLSFLSDLDFKFDNLCLTHLHMVMVIMGKCCVVEDHQIFVRGVLTRLGELGLDSAYYNLKKLESVWSGELKSGENSEEDEDILTW